MPSQEGICDRGIDKMTGYKIIAESYKELLKEKNIDQEIIEKKIRIYDFLDSCDEDDFFNLIDSSAFNNIIKSYVKAAIVKSGIKKNEEEKILQQINLLLEDSQSKEIYTNTYNLK